MTTVFENSDYETSGNWHVQIYSFAAIKSIVINRFFRSCTTIVLIKVNFSCEFKKYFFIKAFIKELLYENYLGFFIAMHGELTYIISMLYGIAYTLSFLHAVCPTQTRVPK